MRKIFSGCLLILIIINLLGCGGQSNHPSSSSTGSVRVKIKWPDSLQAKTILPGTQSIKISVTDSLAARNVITEKTINSPDTDAVFEGLPGDSCVHVQARAYPEIDGSGGIISFGESDLLYIYPNKTNEAAVSLKRNVDFALILDYDQNLNLYKITQCYLTKYCNEPNSNTFFNNAVIKVAGYIIPLYGNGLFLRDPIPLTPGQQVNVEVSHPSFGTYTATLTVPANVPSFTTVPDDLNQWVNGSVQELTISWSPVVCDQYYVEIEEYNVNKVGYASDWLQLTGTSTTFEHYVLGSAAYVDLSVTAWGYAKIADFYDSELQIRSRTTAKKTTLP
ncbi:MAG TPA: hypothetical protein VHY08_15505 [Bacillota bacterium]|nr:hypothetical protein [Bacillota bacterium]